MFNSFAKAGSALTTLSVLAFTVITASSANANSTTAAVVHSCEELDSIGNLVGSVKTFSKGAIRVAHVSTDEPVAAPDHLLIFVYEEMMSRSCFAVSAEGEMGFGSLDFSRLKSSYDSAKGLLLTFPVGAYDPETGNTKPAGTVKARISRKNGSSTVTIEK